jgi:hypothetical protein
MNSANTVFFNKSYSILGFFGSNCPWENTLAGHIRIESIQPLPVEKGMDSTGNGGKIYSEWCVKIIIEKENKNEP